MVDCLAGRRLPGSSIAIESLSDRPTTHAVIIPWETITPVMYRETCMWEYCSVAYRWKGWGHTQEIDILYLNGVESRQWEGKYWNDFLNQMGQERWELTTAIELTRGDGNTEGIVAYFKRPS